MGINRIKLQAGSPAEMVKAQEAAASDPALDAIRQQLFGEDYVQDIGEGRGIAQYYTGFGLPQSLRFTPPVEEAAPVVDTTQSVVDTGGGGGGGEAGGVDITTPTITGGGAQNPLTQMVTDPVTGQTQTVKQAMTSDAAYSLDEAPTFADTGRQDLLEQAGNIPGIGYATDFFPDINVETTKPVATFGDTTTGLEDYLEGIDLATGRAETIDTRATEPPSLGFGTPPEADIYQDPIMGMVNMNQADVMASDANIGLEAFNPTLRSKIGDAFESVKDQGAAGINKFKDSLVALGGKVKEGFDNTIEIGGKTIDLTKSLIGGAISLVIPGAGLVLGAIEPDKYNEEALGALGEIGMLKTTAGGLTVDKYGKNVQSITGDYDDYNLERQIDLQEQFEKSKEDYVEEYGSLTAKNEYGKNWEEMNKRNLQELEDREIIEQKLNETRLEEAQQEQKDYVQEIEDLTPVQSGSDDARDQQRDTGVASVSTGIGGLGSGGYQTSSGDVYASAVEAAEKGDGPSGGDRKIVCTMMNDSYGFGSFRNKIWLRHSKDLAPEYQIGYHKIFLPLVRLSKTNKLLKKTLEHIAVHRTIDIRQEARGKKHLLGRVYRKILEPICYWVGKYAKR